MPEGGKGGRGGMPPGFGDIIPGGICIICIPLQSIKQQFYTDHLEEQLSRYSTHFHSTCDHLASVFGNAFPFICTSCTIGHCKEDIWANRTTNDSSFITFIKLRQKFATPADTAATPADMAVC